MGTPRNLSRNYVVIGHVGALTGRVLVDDAVEIAGWDAPYSYIKTGDHWSMRVLGVKDAEEAKKIATLGIATELSLS